MTPRAKGPASPDRAASRRDAAVRSTRAAPIHAIARTLIVAASCGLAACAGAPPTATPPVPYRPIAKLHPRLDADWRRGLAPGTALDVLLDVGPTADPDRLRALGAWTIEVARVTDRGPSGVRAEATTDSASLRVALPVDALPFVAALPWVEAIAPMIAWTDRADRTERKLSPSLRELLDEHGAARRYAVRAAVDAQGCLTDERRAELADLGVVIGSALAPPDCASSIITVELPLAVLLELADRPWVVQVESERLGALE